MPVTRPLSAHGAGLQVGCRLKVRMPWRLGACAPAPSVEHPHLGLHYSLQQTQQTPGLRAPHPLPQGLASARRPHRCALPARALRPTSPPLSAAIAGVQQPLGCLHALLQLCRIP